mgnify:CR=1 FL=1|jgi:SAM-dependent methyltransferase
MTKINKILAHHAAARLYHRKTGRLPAPEELARLVDEEVYFELKAYKASGDIKTAAAVMTGDQLEMDLGQLYQLLKKTAEKKDLGQVFTPMPAVEAALDLVKVMPERVIDPACGAGNFLLGCSSRWPRARLAGVDVDPLAIAVAETRLKLAEHSNVCLLNANAFNLSCSGAFDLVTGNPPWGGNLAPDLPKDSSFPGNVNSFIYFLELAARLLQPGGQLVYVLPEAFTKVRIYQRARAWLLENFAISGLHYIPKLFAGYYAPAVILAAVKMPGVRVKGVPVWYQKTLKESKVEYSILPAEALQPQRYHINWRQEMEELWQQCSRDAICLQEGELGACLPEGRAVVDFSLGIVTGGNRDFLHAQPAPGRLLLLQARDIAPYVISPPSCWLEYDRVRLQQAAPLEKYQAAAKIVYRFIAREIIAAIDYSGSLTLNNLNIILPLRLPFPLEYLVALLNSKLLNTLYMYKFFTGKVLTRQLKQLPLRLGKEMEITVLAQKLAQGERRTAEMDHLIFDLYGLDQGQRSLVAEQHRRLKEMFFV